MRIIRKIIGFVMFINLTVMAVAVSDNDGSAFITKAEFDSLKNNFQSQIDQYNIQIDSKIDSAISTYLSGIKVELESDIRTAFNIIGDSPNVTGGEIIKNMHFLGKDTIPEYSQNVPYTSSIISWIGTIGFGPKEKWQMDANNTLQAKGTWSDGETDNKVLVSDNGYVEEWLVNVKVNENRNSVAQGRDGNVFWSGGVWKSISLTAVEPTELQATSWTQTDTSPCLNGTFEGWGMRTLGKNADGTPKDFEPGENNWHRGRDIWYRPTDGSKAFTIIGNGSVNVFYLNTNYNINYSSESNLNTAYHWPFGSNNQLMVKTKVKDSDGNETKKGHYRWGSSVNFTKTRPFFIATGKPLYAMGNDTSIKALTTDGMTINGTTPKLNCDLDYPNNYKYKKIKDIWDQDAKMTGGLLLINSESASNNGTLEIQFKSDTNNTWLYFKSNEFVSKPNENDSRNIECEIYDETTNKYIKTYNPKLANSGTTYKLKIPVKKNESIYMALSNDNSDIGYDITLSQVGTPKIIYSS